MEVFNNLKILAIQNEFIVFFLDIFFLDIYEPSASRRFFPSVKQFNLERFLLIKFRFLLILGKNCN